MYVHVYVYVYIYVYMCMHMYKSMRMQNLRLACILKYFQYGFLTINCHMLYLVFEFIRPPKVYTFSFIVGSIIRLSQKV